MDKDLGAVAQFSEHIRSFHTLPVLFVGSGISRRYLGLPDWRGLLSNFSESLGKPVTYYEGKTLFELPGVASELAKDLYESWWSDPNYADSRAQDGQLIQQYSDPLKFEIARYIGGFESTRIDPELTIELDTLSKVNAHAIITTNWDHLLEKSFPTYQSFVGQESILFAETQGVGEIYKIHGSIEDPNSLVLTHEDYLAYEAKNPYLLAKIMTFFVENPIVFLGYSLTDNHIQGLLGKLLDCISPGNIEKLNDRLIFIRRPNHLNLTGYRMAPMLLSGRTINVIECVADSFTPFFQLMADLPRRFPLKMLRQLKRQVYELAYTEDTTGRIHVLDIDDNTKLNDVDIVIGVGTMAALSERGYIGLTRNDLVVAMLRDEQSYSADKLVNDVIPIIFRASTKWAPIFYPLYLYTLSHDGHLRSTDDLPSNAKLLLDFPDIKPYFVNPEAKGVPFSEYSTHEPAQVLSFGLACSFDKDDDIEALRDFLLEIYLHKPTLVNTESYKLACRYDQLNYGRKLAILQP
jgi:hypothetical protein